MVKTNEIKKMEKKLHRLRTGGYNPLKMTGSWLGGIIGLLISLRLKNFIMGFLIGWIIQSLIRHFRHKHRRIK
jgi:uncharacterized protein YqgC (DUF456 family)